MADEYFSDICFKTEERTHKRVATLNHTHTHTRKYTEYVTQTHTHKKMYRLELI